VFEVLVIAHRRLKLDLRKHAGVVAPHAVVEIARHGAIAEAAKVLVLRCWPGG
jgi:hypothetical protein